LKDNWRAPELLVIRYIPGNHSPEDSEMEPSPLHRLISTILVPQTWFIRPRISGDTAPIRRPMGQDPTKKRKKDNKPTRERKITNNLL
jgi:hypothetical protein